MIDKKKEFFENKYSVYWNNARKNKYAFNEYHESCLSLIIDNVEKKSKVLDVALGNGSPFADFLQKSDFEVHGIDISPLLIKEANKLNENISCEVMDAENLTFKDNTFKSSYCFASTWYFTDPMQAIKEMVRVTEEGGLIFFDIQNKNDLLVNKNYLKHLKGTKGFGLVYKYLKNIAKILSRKGFPDWTTFVWMKPIYVEEVVKFLNKIDLQDIKILPFKEGKFVALDDYGSYGSILFILKK